MHHPCCVNPAVSRGICSFGLKPAAVLLVKTCWYAWCCWFRSQTARLLAKMEYW